MKHLKIYESFLKRKKEDKKSDILIHIEKLLDEKWLHKFDHIFQNKIEDNYIYIKIIIKHNISNTENSGVSSRYNTNYKDFIQLINYIESYTDFYMAFGNAYLVINAILFNNKVNQFIEELGANINSDKYNI